MTSKLILLLLGTACGPCFFAQAAGAARAIDTTKLESGFAAGCLRQDTDCFFQHVQWQSLQSYTTHEVFVRTMRSALDLELARRWLSEASYCPSLSSAEVKVEAFSIARRVDGRWVTIAPLQKNAAGCLAPQHIKAGETLRVTVDSRITRAADSFLSFSGRLDPAFRDRALLVVSPAAADVPVHFDARNEAGQRTYGVLQQAQVIIVEPKSPPSAVPSIALSTLPSWHALAQLHRQREDSLLDAEPKLPVFAGLSKREVVAQALRWMHARVRYDHDRFRDGAVFPKQSVSAMLDSGMADCKGIALLFRAVMKKNGIDVQTVAVSTVGLRPVSWLIPSAWVDHVISYVPDLDLYLDAGVPWDAQKTLQGHERFRYEMGLNLATGAFGVIR
ncbi:MAG: transglutaminase domain-containing protein [Xanthomonadaceae bacterium]|nr:transglutaminase domain-containing protein [Xanthomonadaceae bacterium]